MFLLILEKGGGGWRREREEKYQCEEHQSVASHVHPNQGWNLQPRYVP